MSVLLVIPARYESTRYPGKPLVALRGASGQAVTLVERTWRAALAVSGVDHVIVATDDERIREHASGFGADVVMTSTSCRNGTERCAEALTLSGSYDIVVNLQGDAPLTPAWFVEGLIAALEERRDARVATPVLRCDGRALEALRNDRRMGRVGGTTAVFDEAGRALYFSKEVVPFTAESYPENGPTPVFHHVGVYAYRSAALADYVAWQPGRYELLEGLEQLRFIENGVPVLCVEVHARGRQFWELNNPSDVPRLEAMLAEMGMD